MFWQYYSMWSEKTTVLLSLLYIPLHRSWHEPSFLHDVKRDGIEVKGKVLCSSVVDRYVPFIRDLWRLREWVSLHRNFPVERRQRPSLKRLVSIWRKIIVTYFKESITFLKYESYISIIKADDFFPIFSGNFIYSVLWSFVLHEFVRSWI